jgi:hypothetical protein
LVSRLSPFIGTAQANTLVWSTIWLVPGVFGFLVWELRGNWRLYAANRPRTLQPQSVGRHGETMLAFLRPTFHSGTLPKLFARLRRGLRRAQKTGDTKQLSRQQSALRDAHRNVQHFVERELLGLLVESGAIAPNSFSVQSVRLATNRVEVALDTPSADSQCWIVWEETDRRLVGSVKDNKAFATMPASERQQLEVALAGLFQRTGVDEVHGSIGQPIGQPITWSNWVGLWSNTQR